MNEVTALIDSISRKEKLVAMLAPSFPIIFEYPIIISNLRKLGFTYVVEVSKGARVTNTELITALKNNPQARFITTPCPSIVRLIKKQYPHLSKYLTTGVDSPMIATAKIVIEKYPGYRPVFIGPCLVKKLEANEDYPDLKILVLTYKEINEVFKHFNIQPNNNYSEALETDKFDIAEEGMTRIYPTDGGLAHSSGLVEAFSKEQVRIVSGWKNCQEALNNFEESKEIKILDILHCEGGCIGGPGIQSHLNQEERMKKVFTFWLSGMY